MSPRRVGARRLAWKAAFLAAGVLLGAVVFRGENFLERLFVDLRFFVISALHPQGSTSDTVVIVAMDNASEDALGVRFGAKWRQFHPRLLRVLSEAGAALIVFDSKFLDDEPAWDPGLAAALKESGNVLAGEDEPGSTIGSLRHAFLAIGDLRWKVLGGVPRAVGAGSPDDPAGRAGLEPLSVAAVRLFSERTGSRLPPLPRGRPAGFWINFRWEPGYFFSFSYADVLAAADGRLGDPRRTALSVFTDRIVLVGLDDGMSLADRFVFPNTMLARLPGVFGHAYAVETILQGRAVTRVPPWVDAVLAAGLLLGLLALLDVRARRTRTLLLAALPVAAFVAATLLLSAANLWIGYAPLLVGYLAVLLLHWVQVRLALSSRLSRAMGFDPRLMEAFHRESDRAGGPVRREVSILIADVRNYTAYVSGTDSAVVSRVMAEYMAAMETCITAEGGYINKYVGDEIIAVFGFPLAAERGPERAVRAALAMLGGLAGLVERWRRDGVACIERIGIGVDTGPVVFAEIGGRTKSQFDIIGDCINGASRIEHLTKVLKRPLLISEETCRGIEGNDALSGSFAFVKRVPVRGQGPRRIYARIS